MRLEETKLKTVGCISEYYVSEMATMSMRNLWITVRSQLGMLGVAIKE